MISCKKLLELNFLLLKLKGELDNVLGLFKVEISVVKIKLRREIAVTGKKLSVIIKPVLVCSMDRQSERLLRYK